MIALWRIDTRCNLACGFCAYDRRLPKSRAHVSYATAVATIDRLAEGGATHLSWIGGEPTLWPPLAPASAYAKSKGLRVSLTTNGTRLAAMRTCLLALDELTISLDAIDGLHDQLRGWPGGTKKLLDGITSLAAERARPLLRINVVLMRSAIGAFSELCRVLVSAGVDEVTFNALGWRDRPDFSAEERLRPSDLIEFAATLPALREEIKCAGGRLVGTDAYVARLRDAASGIPHPVADCAPGSVLWFIDELGRVAPCAFTLDDYGVPVAQIERGTLAMTWRNMQRHRRSAVCEDCPSTQVAGKFAFSCAPGSDGH